MSDVHTTDAGSLPDPAEMMTRLFPKRRVRLIVEADLDPMPGWGNDSTDWQRMLQRHLDDIVGHYHPTVVVDPNYPHVSPGTDGDA